MAGMFFAIACWKGLAFTREPTATLALMTVNFFIGGAVYVLASPMGYEWLGTLSGQPWIATLPIYLGILVCYGKMHLLTLLWTPSRPDEPKHTLRTVTAWAVAYCVSLVIMTVAFLSADLDGPADPLRFNTDQADEPWVLTFLAVFLAMLTSGTLNTWRRSRRAKVLDERIAHALRWFGRSMVVTFGYVVCSGPAIIAAANGHHELDNVGVLGASFGMLGCVGTCYGMSGAAVSAWLRERHDIAQLQPLWDLVVADVDVELAFSSTRARPNRFLNIRWALHRRIIEILDGIRELRKWISDEPAQLLKALHHQSLANDTEDESAAAAGQDPVQHAAGLPRRKDAVFVQGAAIRFISRLRRYWSSVSPRGPLRWRKRGIDSPLSSGMVPPSTTAARSRFELPPGGLSPQELDAVVTAAVLRHAVGQLKARRVKQADNVGHSVGLPDRSAVEVPGRDTAASQERPRLVRVARALNHPLVEATLQHLSASRGADQACREPAV
jgi:hypothetical protein